MRLLDGSNEAVAAEAAEPHDGDVVGRHIYDVEVLGLDAAPHVEHHLAERLTRPEPAKTDHERKIKV